MAKATCSSRLGAASTTSRVPSLFMSAASCALIVAIQANCSRNSPKRAMTRLAIAGTSSNSATAGCRINARASSRMAKKKSSAVSDASALGRPQPLSLSASGERITVRTSAVTTGRNTTAPIDRTNGRAKNSPSPINSTSDEIRRSSCSAKASLRDRLRLAGASVSCEGSALLITAYLPIHMNHDKRLVREAALNSASHPGHLRHRPVLREWRDAQRRRRSSAWVCCHRPTWC